MNTLIVYGTTEGQTRKIARYIGEVLQEEGHLTTIADAADGPPSPEGFDMVLVGASVHMGKYQSAVTHYLKQNLSRLSNKPTAFFSVCMAIASDHPEEHKESEKIMNDYLAHIGWQPMMKTEVAGALKFTQYDFFKRLVMRMIARREGHGADTKGDHEYTDWDSVKSFALSFAKKAQTSTISGGAEIAAAD